MSNIKNEQTNVCHLFRLPPELRETIYLELFAQEMHYCDKLQISLDQQVFLPTCARLGGGHSADDAAILKTCRLLYTEALPVLYECYPFIVTITGTDRIVEAIRLGTVASTPSIWRNIRHVKLVVEFDYQIKYLQRNVSAWIDACRGNASLDISEVKLESPASIAVPVEPVLKVLSRLEYPGSPKLWLKASEEGSVSCPDVSLRNFLDITGGRDCSVEFEREENQKRFTESNDDAWRAWQNWQPDPSKWRSRAYPAWELIDRKPRPQPLAPLPPVNQPAPNRAADLERLALRYEAPSSKSFRMFLMEKNWQGLAKQRAGDLDTG